MGVFRHPLLPVGVLLVVLGAGNCYAARGKIVEYERLLETDSLPGSIEHLDDFRELDPHTSATVLNPLQRGSDEHSLVGAKLDFYKVVQSGGRMLTLLGLFCIAAALIRVWYRQRSMERLPATAGTRSTARA